MKHVGVCTQDGPEERAGELHLELSASSSLLEATLSVAGVQCRYSGRLSDVYTGTMTCPDREAVPLKLGLKKLEEFADRTAGGLPRGPAFRFFVLPNAERGGGGKEVGFRGGA